MAAFAKAAAVGHTPEAPSRPEPARRVGGQNGKGLDGRREERPPTRALRGSVSAEPAEWLNADLHATRVPRTTRTIAINKHAPMNPAIR